MYILPVAAVKIFKCQIMYNDHLFCNKKLQINCFIFICVFHFNIYINLCTINITLTNYTKKSLKISLALKSTSLIFLFLLGLVFFWQDSHRSLIFSDQLLLYFRQTWRISAVIHAKLSLTF